jgi:DNA-binding CsgD family transcriptional regulator
VLIGRQAECERLTSLIAAAKDGGGGALLLHGEAGIGKTALLRFARERAEEGGLRLLGARGLETEADLPYTGLHDLLAPLLERSAKGGAAADGGGGAEGSAAGPTDAMAVLRERLPSAQATALGQALALGPEGTPQRFAVPAAVLGLLASAAEEGPVLCIVDDVQWVDAPSVEAVAFAARRLRGDGIAILFAQRERIGRALDPAGLDSLRVEPLSDDAAGSLLRGVHGQALAGTVAAELVQAAGGNPLALVELSRALDPGQLAGRAPLPPVLPEALTVEAAFERELAELPEDTRRALVVTAAADASEDAAVLGRALALSGIPPWVLDAAESANVIEVRGARVDFRHPLMRAAAYHAAEPPERRAAHRALADAHAEGAPQRAWHLAAAAVGTDDEAAAVLERAAADARVRGGFASAARAESRAAELSVEGAETARHLLAAARDFVAAGDPEQAAARAEQGLELSADAPARADLAWVLGHVWLRLGRAEDAIALLRDHAAEIEPTDRGRASMLLLEATVAQLPVGDAAAVVAAGERARAVGEGNPLVESLADVIVGQSLIAGGRCAEGARILATAEPFLRSLDPVHVPSDVSAIAANGFLWVDRLDVAGALLTPVIDAARDLGALARLAYPLNVQSVLDFRRGRWADAVAHAEESLRAGIDTGQDALGALGNSFAAQLYAHRGLHRESIETATEAVALCERTRSFGFVTFAHFALGTAHLVAGDPEAAAAALECAREWAQRLGTFGAGWAGWQPELVEAYVALGRTKDARSELDRLLADNPGEQPPTVRVLLDRSRALVHDDDAVALLEGALEHPTPSPFELARTELMLGERLRRRRDDRLEARRRLRSALDTFDRLGAGPWASRAREELRASGVVSTRDELAVVDVLTPHELQVALVVARGATNKDAAAQLFLSPKTVEHHLGAIYRKLDIRSRTDLARLLSAQGEPDAAAA